MLFGLDSCNGFNKRNMLSLSLSDQKESLPSPHSTLCTSTLFQDTLNSETCFSSQQKTLTLAYAPLSLFLLEVKGGRQPMEGFTPSIWFQQPPPPVPPPPFPSLFFLYFCCPTFSLKGVLFDFLSSMSFCTAGNRIVRYEYDMLSSLI